MEFILPDSVMEYFKVAWKQTAFLRLWQAVRCVIRLWAKPHDYDIATSARPEEVKKLFPPYD